MRSRFLAPPVLFLLLAGAAPAVNIDYDTGADFSKYKTFAWKEGSPAPNPLTQDRIRKAVLTEIKTRGLTEATGKPDLYVLTHAAVKEEKRVDVTNYGYGGYGRYGYRTGGWGTTDVNVYNVRIGHLVIDLVDAETNKLVWRGSASAMATKNPNKSEKRINKYVQKMLKKYPPR